MLIAYGDDHWFDFALRVLTLAAAKASVRTFVEMGLLQEIDQQQLNNCVVMASEVFLS